MPRNSKGQFTKGSGLVDKTGERYGRLTVVSLSEKRSGRKTYWLCKCDCGNYKEVRSDCLGSVNSCGCLKKEQDSKNLTKHHRHKLSGTRLYREWQGMKRRCLNANDNRYSDYGGRGIKICNEWLVADNFFEWALNSGYSDELTIDRIDVNGNYEPSNCRWATIKEQSNNRRSNVLFTHRGKTQTLTQWAEEFGINPHTCYTRYLKTNVFDEIFSLEPLNKCKIELTYNNETKTLVQWIEELNLSKTTCYRKYRKGCSVEEILNKTIPR